MRTLADPQFEYFYVIPLNGCHSQAIDRWTRDGYPYAVQIQNLNKYREFIGPASERVEGVAGGASDIRKATELKKTFEFEHSDRTEVILRWNAPTHESYVVSGFSCSPAGSAFVKPREPQFGLAFFKPVAHLGPQQITRAQFDLDREDAAITWNCVVWSSYSRIERDFPTNIVSISVPASSDAVASLD